MDAKTVEELKENFKAKDTSELLHIWKSNDRRMYIDEAFEAVKLLLGERGVKLPEQSATITGKNHLEKAYGFYREGRRFDRALEECDSAIAMEPSLADAHNLRGVLLQEMGRPAEALNAFKKALEIEPGFNEAQENLSGLKAALEAANNLKTIAEFYFPSEAYVARMALEAEGIQVFLADEETLFTASHLSFAIGGVKLKVKPEDAKRALEILQRGAGPPESD